MVKNQNAEENMSGKWKVFWVASLAFVVLFQACGMHSWEEFVVSKEDEKRMGREFDSLVRAGHPDVMASGETLFEPNGSEQQAFMDYYKARGREIVNVIDAKDVDALIPTNSNLCGGGSSKQKCTKDNFFEFQIIKSSQLNAFAVPGGYVYFYTPILKFFDSEAELMGVLAHEVGHIVMHHSRDRMVKAAGATIGISVLLGEGIGALLATLGSSVWLMGHSQANEFEADSVAYYYTNKIGVSSIGISDFFGRPLETDEKGNCKNPEKESSVLDVFSTHPPSCERIQKNNDRIAKSGQTLSTHPLNRKELGDFAELVRAANL